VARGNRTRYAGGGGTCRQQKRGNSEEREIEAGERVTIRLILVLPSATSSGKNLHSMPNVSIHIQYTSREYRNNSRNNT